MEHIEKKNIHSELAKATSQTCKNCGHELIKAYGGYMHKKESNAACGNGLCLVGGSKYYGKELEGACRCNKPEPDEAM